MANGLKASSCDPLSKNFFTVKIISCFCLSINAHHLDVIMHSTF